MSPGKPLIVLALGGNALLRKDQKGTPEEQWETIQYAAKQIARILETNNVNMIITHGNGPQVGMIIEAFECLPREKPRPTLDIANAMTQGWIGYMISHSLTRISNVETVVVATRVIVSRKDPSFTNPSKYIGSYYSEEEAKQLMREKGWIMKPDPRKGWRRVVPSPKPLHVLESKTIEELARAGKVVIAVGGGGIPVDEELNPVEAVVDKDLASSLLAREVNADKLIILTDVPAVAINYGKPDMKWIREITVDKLRQFYEQGHFPPGSMGPKVLAAIEFVEKTGKPAAIGLLEEAYNVYLGKSGTQIIP
jgi:carbamate kinase